MPVQVPDSALVEAADVASALVRPLTDDENAIIEDLAVKATALLRTALPTLDARMTNPDAVAPITEDAVRGMLGAVIARVLVNPEGLWSKTDTAGPFSESKTFPGARGGQAVAELSRGLVITPQDLAKLSPVVAFSMPGTMRVRPWGS